jgi:pimeloyl-ACP methyl ester carboxylesterase
VRTMPNSHKAYCGALVAETGYFRSGANELSFSCVIPPEDPRQAGVVFVHAADGNRLGPHRMFVELAHELGSTGYPTLRFDLSGCGDSTGRASQGDIDTEVSDLLRAIEFFMTRANLKSVVLLGISRGAVLCHTAMARHKIPLSGMILLSTPVSSGSVAFKSFAMRLREYLWKLTDPKRLWKFLSGRANIRQIWRTLATALGTGQRYRRPRGSAVASRCPILLIYGGNDPTSRESSEYYTKMCRQTGLSCECHFIKGANHSFFHYRWKEQITSISRQWLERTHGSGEDQ